MTWGQAVVFAGYFGFLHYLQLASHELATIGINVKKKRNSKSDTKLRFLNLEENCLSIFVLLTILK